MKKQNIITFKVDKTLMEVIRDIPNRSQFIRAAIVSALGSVCPVCDGAGMLTPNQKRHWDDFSNKVVGRSIFSQRRKDRKER
ncbi:MAG: hypothetical protein JRJ60_23105 [Deltaproteobacteria bacterium]|nr:hypothetical protein [Deltaproteobacteria bacterium]